MLLHFRFDRETDTSKVRSKQWENVLQFPAAPTGSLSLKTRFQEIENLLLEKLKTR